MKSLKLVLSTFLLFFVEIVFSQNYIEYTPLSQTISTTSGKEISVTVVAKCYGNTSNTVLINPTYCIWDSGLTGISFSNGTYLTPGQSSTITFKFKKTVSTSSSFTYKFSTNSSCNQADSSMIKITVNYSSTGSIPCNLPVPSNLVASNVGLRSFQCNWDKRSTISTGSTPYLLQYKKSSDTDWTFYNVQKIVYNSTTCSAVIDDLSSDTYYEWRVIDYCSGAQGSGGVVSNVVATKTLSGPTCPTSKPTNLNATPYSGCWTISFTPDPSSSTNTYEMEYFNLVTNSGGVTEITYSNTPDYSKNFFNAFGSNQSFKFRFLQSCNMNTDWVFINAACPTAPAAGLYVYSNVGSGNFNWDSVVNSQNYQGEYLIYNLVGQQVYGSFTSSNNSYAGYINTNDVTGDKYIKFRIRSLCPNGTWSDYSNWSTTGIWNN